LKEEVEEEEDEDAKDEYLSYCKLISEEVRRKENIDDLCQCNSKYLQEIAEGIGAFDFLCHFHDSYEFEDNNQLCSCKDFKGFEKREIPGTSSNFLCMVTGDIMDDEKGVVDHIKEN